MAKDKRVEILFDRKQYKRLEEAAHREGKSVGALVREAVAKYVVPSEGQRTAALKRLATTDTGIAPGSPEDIRTAITKDLDEYIEHKLDLEAD